MNRECKLPGCNRVFNAKRINQEYCSKQHRDEARKNRSRLVRVPTEHHRSVQRLVARREASKKHGNHASSGRTAINPDGVTWRAVMLFLVDHNPRLVLRLAKRQDPGFRIQDSGPKPESRVANPVPLEATA